MCARAWLCDTCVCLCVYVCTCTTCNKCVSARFSRVARLQYDGVSLFIIFNRSYGSARVRTKRDLANRSMRLLLTLASFFRVFFLFVSFPFFPFLFLMLVCDGQSFFPFRLRFPFNHHHQLWYNYMITTLYKVYFKNIRRPRTF